MKYQGSKRRILKHILPIMLAERQPDQWWVEPFVGGGNVIERVPGKRLGADVDPHVVSALISIRDHLDELPRNNREFTEDDYKRLRSGSGYTHKAYAGYAFSYGAKWLGGWRRDDAGRRDYVAEAYGGAVRQSPLLAGVQLVVSDYADLAIPDQSVIYCDIPYAGTTKYKYPFDHVAFWLWCRQLASQGHTVFVSEYDAPAGIQCVWDMPIMNSLERNTGKGNRAGIEKLFKIKE